MRPQPRRKSLPLPGIKGQITVRWDDQLSPTAMYGDLTDEPGHASCCYQQLTEWQQDQASICSRKSTAAPQLSLADVRRLASGVLVLVYTP